MNKIYQQLAFGVACVVLVGAAHAQTAPLDRLREIVRNNVAAAAGAHGGKGNEVGPTTAFPGNLQPISIQEVRPSQVRAPSAPARSSTPRVSTPAPAARIAPLAVVPLATPAVAAAPAVTAAPVVAPAAVSASASVSAPVQQPMLSVKSLSVPSLPLPQQTEAASAVDSTVPATNSSLGTAEQRSLSSLLALNSKGSENTAQPLAAPSVYLKIQQTQGKALYLIDQQSNEGLVFFALTAEDFERVAGFQLLDVQSDTLVGVTMSSAVHQELLATSSAAIAQAEEGVGLVELPDGVVRVVTNIQSSSDR